MKPFNRVLVLVGIGGTWYVLSKSGALAGTGLALDDVLASIGAPLGLSAQAQQVQANALQQPGPGNSPISPAASILGLAGSAASIVAGLGGGGGAGAGIGISLATAGIIAGVVIVVFLTFRFLRRQRASMQTNDVRDLWQRQFVDLHRQMGFEPVPLEQQKGVGPGTLEMAEIIYYFDHDDSQQLWKAVQQTQDQNRMIAAANAIDNFLGTHGIPVQDVAA